MSTQIPSLQKLLFSRFVAYLVLAQVVFLGIGIAVVSFLLQQQQMEELDLRSLKAVELFGNLAKYGDVRYARFMVRSNGAAGGLSDFRVHTGAGDEIQASDPASLEALDPALVTAAKKAAQAFPQDGTIHAIKIKSDFHINRGAYSYALKTADGSEYIVTSVMNGPSLPWLWITLGALGLILLSGCLAVALARGRIRKTSEALAGYAIEVRGITVESDPAIAVPFSELLPLQQALSGMVVDLREQTKNAAISKLMSALSHDIRKPFSLLRMTLTMLGRAAADPEKVKSILDRVNPEITKAVASVDGMLADILEYGSTATDLITEPVAVESLLDGALNDIFRVYPKSDVTLSYDLRHTNLVSAHGLKVARVLGNLLGNAIQALNYCGKLWINTTDVVNDGKSFVQFCIGNAGFIPPAGIAKLFSGAYYTSKSEGTGLGTQIVQKIVTNHGGRVWVESSKTAAYPQGKVEFFFTLPSAEGQTRSVPALPTHSSVITKAILALTEGASSETTTGASQTELDLEAQVIQATKSLGRSLRILIVDDEDLYRQSLASSFSRTPDLSNALVIRMAAGSQQALELSNKSYDLIITDVDMGPSSLCGFELVGKLRSLPGGAKSLISVCSNRVMAQDHKTAIDSGADAFVSKPASRGQLLKLVLQAARKAIVEAEGTKTAAVDTSTKPEILVLDDNPFILEAWAETLKPGAVVHLLASPEALTAKLEKEPTFLDRLTCVITDHNFDGSKGDGLDVGRMIKSRRSTLTVLLSSDGEFNGVDLTGSVNRLIAKDPVSYSELRLR